MRPEFPILEYDPERKAVIEPPRPAGANPFPTRCVLCFFGEVIERWREEGSIHRVTSLTTAMGEHPVYGWQVGDQRVGLMHPGVGAPLAALLVEELIGLGCTALIACGGAGVLDKRIAAGHLIVPTSAVRDEGTSYHYLPPSREVEASPLAVKAIRSTLDAAGVAYRLGKTWTTDGVYRETPGKIAARAGERCLTVEMEAASLFAIAKFRGVILGQILYGGDDVSGLTWDRRDGFDRTAVREALLRLAGTACTTIPPRTEDP